WAESIETVDLSSLDAGNVVDMNGVFRFCRSLKTFIPPKNVVRVVGVVNLFQNCESLRTVDVSWLEQSELEGMALMFASCFQLEEVRGLTSLKTGKVKSMQQLFQSCRKLKHLDLSGWDVVNMDSAKWMFQNCSSLESVDMSGSAVGERQVRTAVDALTTESMFENCTSLKSVDLSGLNDNPVGHMVNMFAGCESLTDVKMHFTSLLPMTNMARMFADCRSLKALDLTWLENVTEPPYKFIIRCGFMLDGCTGLESIDLGFSADNIILDHQQGAYQDLLAPCSNLKVCYVPANVTEDWSIGLTLYELTGESTDLFPKNLQESRPYYTEIGRAEALAQLERFVSRMYTVALGREAEAAGLEDWTGRLIRQETDGAGIAHGFIESDEFHNRNLTDEAFVTVLYHTFFDREPDEAGYRDWMDSLSAGYCRRYVLRGFVNSDEFGNLCDSFGITRGTYTITEDEEIPHPVIHREMVQAFVTRLYEKCLNREGEPAGIEDWTERIMSGEWEAGDVARIGFFFSEEYQNRARTDEEYVTDMYHAFFDREPDEAGYADWTGQLADGADRLSVIYGFTDSDEFKHLLESYGLQ
nr:DUF4214 domain-containing protein [Lachnospiraceae bacterium]